MMSESRDYFTLVLNVGTKNTHTHHISFFSEPHYIGQEVNNISTHIHDQLRQQYIMSVKSFFWKGRKEENNAIFRQNSSRVVLVTYTGH